MLLHFAAPLTALFPSARLLTKFNFNKMLIQYAKRCYSTRLKRDARSIVSIMSDLVAVPLTTSDFFLTKLLDFFSWDNTLSHHKPAPYRIKCRISYFAWGCFAKACGFRPQLGFTPVAILSRQFVGLC